MVNFRCQGVSNISWYIRKGYYITGFYSGDFNFCFAMRKSKRNNCKLIYLVD